MNTREAVVSVRKEKGTGVVENDDEGDELSRSNTIETTSCIGYSEKCIFFKHEVSEYVPTAWEFERCGATGGEGRRWFRWGTPTIEIPILRSWR